MTTRWGRALVVGGFLAIGLGAPGVVRGQGTLEEAAEKAREAWLAHRAGDLLAGSDTVRLQLPGVARSPALDPGQAERLLGRYLGMAGERAFEIQGLRRVAEDHGYVEALRQFVIAGTEDRREETVFIGFRLVEGVWSVREVRVVP